MAGVGLDPVALLLLAFFPALVSKIMSSSRNLATTKGRGGKNGEKTMLHALAALALVGMAGTVGMNKYDVAKCTRISNAITQLIIQH